MYWCTIVILYLCTGVPLYWCTIIMVDHCTGVPLYRCTLVLVYHCTSVTLYWCTTVLLYCTDTPLYCCTTVLVYCTNTTKLFIAWFTSTRECHLTNIFPRDRNILIEDQKMWSTFYNDDIEEVSNEIIWVSDEYDFFPDLQNSIKYIYLIFCRTSQHS